TLLRSTAPLSVSCVVSARATPALYTLALHDALPIFACRGRAALVGLSKPRDKTFRGLPLDRRLADAGEEPRCGLRVIDLESGRRSEEHTSELQSRENLVCRLLLEKKNQSTHQSYRKR